LAAGFLGVGGMLVSAFVAAITCDGSVVMLKLGTIEQEDAACRARWKGFGIGTLAAHVHHNVSFEILTQSAGKRIAYILRKKPEDERALRLRCFAPVDLTGFPKLRKSVAIWNRAVAAWRKARAESEETSALWRKTVVVLLKPKPNATREKLYDACKQANIEWWKAKAKLLKTEVALRKICVTIPHKELCPLGPDCPWDGKTIFPEAK
jgi:hypothetical protein